MKANLRFARLLTVALTAACTVKTSLVAETVPAPNSKLQITAATGANLANVQVADAYNRVWVLQSSSNLTNWSEAAALKIHNGSFAQGIPKAGATPNVFFRAFYDSARQDVLSTVDSALHLPAPSFNYVAPVLPLSFTVNPILAQDNTPLNNLTTDNGATLGRVLFYDKRLSTNQTISCSSCHQQAHGFSDPRQFSVGFNGGLTGRNSMGLSHARWYQRRSFFWDERANTLEDQVLQPIQNSVEMGMTLDALTNRLAAEPYYTNLFAKTFGSTAVTSDRISRALAQFVRSIVSTASKFTTVSASSVSSRSVSSSSSSVCCKSAVASLLPSSRAYVRAQPYPAIS
jgi:cytochrome c peroxidase